MASARATFFASIIYLPLLLAAIVLDRALLVGAVGVAIHFLRAEALTGTEERR